MRTTLTAITTLLALAGVAPAVAPKVAISTPDTGEIGVDPAVKEIRVEFDQPMDSRGRSIVGGGELFPKIEGGDPRWLNERTFLIPVRLEPEHEYRLSINSDTFKGFCNKKGEPADWYPIWFRTRAAGAKPPAVELTPERNRQAITALRKAIDKDYSYRDRKKVDWTKEFATRQARLQSSNTANEFARATAHLLRLAEDAHVMVAAGEVTIGTRSNSVPPNFNVQTLQQAVPSWKEYPGGIVTGRFDDGIGYIMFSACSKEQADSFDAALDGLIETKDLILDARPNGGGDELAARQVAGRFVEKAAVYSKDRLRERGIWKGPFNRIVEPRQNVSRYAKPVVVLIGPKVGSSAESFALMMRYGARAKLIGNVTKGSSGRPVPHDLGNGVNVHLSSWEDQLPDGTVLEGRGVQPDVVVKTTLSELQHRDRVLEEGLKLLRGRNPRTPAEPGSRSR